MPINSHAYVFNVHVPLNAQMDFITIFYMSQNLCHFLSYS